MQICFHYSRDRTAGLYGNSKTNNLRTCQDVFKSDSTLLHSHIVWGLQFLYIIANTDYLSFFIIIIIAILVGVKWYLIVLLIWISPMTYDVEYFFLLSLASYELSLEKCQLRFLAHVSVGLSPCWIIKSSLYILDTSIISDLWFANIFSHSVCFHFCFPDSILWNTHTQN